ncbi:unnamed protein product [Caenorhabditis auriculariae]|uniref:Uncharacterized protein n=1 Tax=Caenorhabditis auriculariae TaxID=2777116 RepID=A0A8S1HQF7_9PELO|nr:unnamed protein product [Caenorhabditis auriculariae]
MKLVIISLIFGVILRRDGLAVLGQLSDSFVSKILPLILSTSTRLPGMILIVFLKMKFLWMLVWFMLFLLNTPSFMARPIESVDSNADFVFPSRPDDDFPIAPRPTPRPSVRPC